MFPQEKIYVLSLAQQNPTSVWDGQLTFAAPDELAIQFPSRFKIGGADASVSLGYAGFWQEYALLPFFFREPALFCQARKHAFVLVSGKNGKRAIGYEHITNGGELSALAWLQPREEPSSFQTEWGVNHSRWGVAAKALLESTLLDLHAELLFTPVNGMDVFVSSSCKYGSSILGFAYGEDPYPSRYSLSLALKSSSIRVSFVMEDWFGPKPIYGGYSAMRKRSQSSEVRVSPGMGYLSFSFSDTYEFKPRGSDLGSVMMQATWGGFFGKISVQYGVSRGPSIETKGQYKLSLVLYKASLSYTDAGYVITLSDSVAMGKGIGTWKLKKSMGNAVSLALLYAVTSDR